MATLVIPPNTTLYSTERLSNGWAVWIHTNNNQLQRKHRDRNGTYLLLRSDGAVVRVTRDGDDERTMLVMPSLTMIDEEGDQST